jgi:hemolysin activation/secretion protein
MGRLRRLKQVTNGGLLLAVSSGAGALPAWAQDTPGQITPREVVTPPTPTSAPPTTTNVDARGAIAQAACPFEDSDIRLTLSEVRFVRPDGSPLQPVIADTLAQVPVPTGEQSIRVVCDLRDQANAALNRDGWIASVQIPAQSIGSGVLELRVVTARITEVRVRGNPGPYRDVLESRISQLRGFDPLNKRDAERALLLSGDVPGLDVQLSLRPAGTQPGDVIGELAITYRPFTIFANVQNYNARALGRETGYVRAEYYGLTGLQDLTYIGASSTADFEEQRIAQVGHIFGLDNNGTSLGGRFTYAWSRPDLGALELKTDTLIAGFDLVTPLVRTVNTNLRIGIGFDYVDQETSVRAGNGLVPLNLDKLRIGFIRVSGDVLKRRGDGSTLFLLRAGLEARKGFDIFDATPVGSFVPGTALPSRIDGNSRAYVVRGELDATLALGRIFSVAGTARGQWSNEPLLNYEEFSLGNLTIGRGYDPGSNSGDRAIGLRGEVRAAPPISDRVGTEIFGFVDNVWFTNLDRSSTETDRHIRSYGGGLRLTLPNAMLLEAQYARPRDRALTIDATPPTDRFLLSLTVQFRAKAR